MRVLLVGGESAFTTMVTTALRSRGHQVTPAPPQVDQLAATPCELLLVDLDSRRCDGVQLCRDLRTRTDVALIALANRGNGSDGVAALRAGADDYVAQPVSLAELLARIAAVLRRTRPLPNGELALGRLHVDPGQQQVHVDGRLVPLTRKEFRLLLVLARTPGTVVAKERLLLEVWSDTERPRSRTLESHVNTLRTKIRPAATVENVRGVGYRILTTMD